MKKSISLIFLLVLVSIGIFAQSVYAETVSYVLNGKKAVFTDAKPYVDKNNRTMVPVRFISEQLGYQVVWNAKTKQATIKNNGNVVVLKMNSNVLTLNKKEQKMDAKMVSKDGRTYVPLRFVAQAFKGQVNYDNKNKRITIASQPTTPTLNPLSTAIYNNQEAYSFEGKGDATTSVSYVIQDSDKGVIKGTVNTEENGSFNIKKNIKSLKDGKVTISITQIKNGMESEKSSKTFEKDSTIYDLDKTEQNKWSVKNDGTAPIETTKGLNAALKWAKSEGIKTFNILDGTYLISKGDGTVDSNQINVLDNMNIHLSDKAVLQKETNSLQEYSVLYVGPLAKNVTIEGGTLRGDRDTHDYTVQGNYGTNTHEWGYGVNLAGGQHVTVQNMTLEKFTGDGVAIGGTTMSGNTFNKTNLEKGGLDDNGNLIDQTGKIRTIGRAGNFDSPYNKGYRNVHIWLPSGLNNNYYDACFYRKDGSFIKCERNLKVYSKGVDAPDDADYFIAVFNADAPDNVSMTRMVIANSRDITIQNNDIGYNRRQGITAGGEDVKILNNKIHHTSGASPQSGIDIEPGFFPAIGFQIKGNEFYNNKIQTVLSYGDNVVFENNTFKSDLTGAIGLHVHVGFRNVQVLNNTFDGSGMTLLNDSSSASGNTYTNASVLISGAGIPFAQNQLIDSSLNVGAGSGQLIKDVNIVNTGTRGNGKGSLSVGTGPTTLQNVTLVGTPDSPVTIGGYSSVQTKFDHLVMKNGISGATGMPSGLYENSQFSYDGDKTKNLSIQYSANVTMDRSTFKNVTLSTNTNTAEATIKNSTFIYDRDMNAPAIYVPDVKNINVLNNSFTANNLTNASTYMIKIGQYAWTNRDVKALAATVNGNTITSNLAMKGIDTKEAGIGAPTYNIVNNTLYNAKLSLLDKDMNATNKELNQ